MLDEKEILHHLVAAAQRWKYECDKVARLDSMEPPDCRWRHRLPMHLRGYAQCHRDWEGIWRDYGRMEAHDRNYAMGLAHALGDMIHMGWTPEKYASMKILFRNGKAEVVSEDVFAHMTGG
mgnify:CR=1 FL=1